MAALSSINTNSREPKQFDSSDEKLEIGITKIYHQIIEDTCHFSIFSPCFPLNQRWISWSPSQLQVSFDLTTIQETFRKTGLLMLRPLPISDKLLIGCGHNPLVNADRYPHNSFEEAQKYFKIHNHEGWLTINPDLLSRADINTYFGIQPLKILPDHSFSKIAIEGLDILGELESTNRTPLAAFEINRLLKEGGEVYYMEDGVLYKKIDQQYLALRPSDLTYDDLLH